MLFSKIIFFALPLIATAASVSQPISKRDYATIFNDLKDADAKTKALTTAINACTCTTSEGNAAITAEKNLEASIQKLLDDCNKDKGQPAVSSTQATEFINYVNGQLLNDVTALVTALNNAKARFDKIALGPYIRGSLCRIRKLILAACACLKSRAPSAQQAAAQSACDKIIAQIDRAIAVYGSTTC